MNLQNIFDSTDFVHASGTKEELAVAEFLKGQCESLGVSARIEPFRVAMSDIEEAHLFADGKEIPCKAFNCCGSGVVEGELYYMPGTDPVSMAGAKDKVVLFDTQGIGFFAYQDLMKAGAKAILFQYGNAYYPNDDIDQRDLREVVSGEKKVLCAMIHSRQAVELVKNKVKTIRLEVSQKEYDGESHNVIAGLPGKREEFIVLTAHYDSTSLSHGAYDNMSGCAGLLGIMEAMKDKELNYGLRFVFCGSEERGLLGSKAYVRDHEKELEKVALNINLDMIGTYMGKFISCVSAEEKLAGYISYMAAEVGFPVEARAGVYSSDSTPFADKGVPSLSFARIASKNVAPIHCRYDLKEVMSMEQLQKDIDFLAKFTERFANAVVCPVSREIPEKIKKELDEYLSEREKSDFYRRFQNENTETWKNKPSGQRDRFRRRMAGAPSGRGGHRADSLCCFLRDQHSGLLDGRSEIERHHRKRNQGEPQPVVYSGPYRLHLEGRAVFPDKRYEICPSRF